MAGGLSYTGDRKSRGLSTSVDSVEVAKALRALRSVRLEAMESSYKELFLIFGMMAFIIICGTIGLVLFVRYLTRDSRDHRHTGAAARRQSTEEKKRP